MNSKNMNSQSINPRKIQFNNIDGSLEVPNCPVIPYIEGDGIGPDIWAASQLVFDAAVAKVYGGTKQIFWQSVPAGEASFNATGDWLPQSTIDTIKDCRVAIKGPLTTPVGGGIRSLNVALRQILDLYQCVRPIRWYPNVPSPVKNPEKVHMCIFRENTEDIYAGIEFEPNGTKTLEVIAMLETQSGKTIRKDSGIGIKPVSEFGSKRLVRAAFRYAKQHGKPSVTLVHKGNIMKFTEGRFRDWGYEVIQEAEFINDFISWDACQGKVPAGKILVKDTIADNMFQQALLRPDEYSVLACTNLNGDYLSDALAAQVGGLGIAPGGNIGDGYALFEATHGTAPKYAGQDKVNPGSVILSGCMMFAYMGWGEVSVAIEKALEKTLEQKIVTYDFARGMTDATEVSCSAFAKAMVENL
jgi:isocitrate dehydrogenase